MDITKLDLNWGGLGFPSYDGRLEDTPGATDPEPMDSEARGDAAMAIFDPPADTGADPNAVADPAAGDPNADPAADPNADPNAPAALTEEQLAADPRYQELSTFHDSIQPVLEQHGVPDAKELGAQLADSAILYDIMQGNGTPAQLLDTMAQNAAWTNEQKSAIAQDLIGWLTKGGYLKGGEGAPPAAGVKPGERKFDDPLAQEVKSLRERLDKDDSKAQQSQETERKATIFKSVTDKIEQLAKQKGIADPEDMGHYIAQVSSLVGGNAAVIARVQKGNFVDIQKFFTQVHNAEVQRMSRFTAAQLREQNKKNNNPKIPAGGAPPAPAGQPTQKLATTRAEAAVNAERRRAAALEQF